MFFEFTGLFSSFRIEKLSYLEVSFKGLYCNVYDNIFQYIFVLLLAGLVLASAIYNFRNKFVYILILSFFVDFFIPCIMKFGLAEAFIYGGHWVFVIPLLIGWYFYKIQNNKILYKLSYTLMILFTIILIVNNIFRMTEFIQFVNTYYKL